MKTEKIFAGILIVGLIFKFMHWPFSGPILVIGLGALGMIYLLGSVLLFCDKQIKTQNIALSIVAGIFLMNACNGILFRLMFWPFSEPLLMLGVATMPVILGITFLLKSITSRTDLTTYYNNMIKRLSVITILTVVCFFTSPVALVKIIYSSDPERVRLQTQSIMNPGNEEYQKEFNEYIHQKHANENRSADENNQ